MFLTNQQVICIFARRKLHFEFRGNIRIFTGLEGSDRCVYRMYSIRYLVLFAASAVQPQDILL